MPELSTIWFVLLGALFAGYAILDGFDLGAGAVHLYVARRDVERRTVLNAIGPVWDGNEVWLITAGAALFAAFPLVYATVFSGFYLAVVLVLLALILRAVAIEFRSQEEAAWWRRGWDVIFCVASAAAVLLFGVALGNVLRGLALDADGVYRDGLIGLLNPFSICVGLLALALAVHQGAAWLVLKTEAPMAERARRVQLGAAGAIAVVWVAATAIGWLDARRMFDNFGTAPLAWLGPILAAVALGLAFWFSYRRRALCSFLASSTTILGLALIAGAALYPNLVPSTGAGSSLTIDNAHSSNTALGAMLVVAAFGMPLVLAYTAYIYSKFKGKVELGEAGY
jgi:cytochrome d ubiquinol oxidase subunit II